MNSITAISLAIIFGSLVQGLVAKCPANPWASHESFGYYLDQTNQANLNNNQSFSVLVLDSGLKLTVQLELLAEQQHGVPLLSLFYRLIKLGSIANTLGNLVLIKLIVPNEQDQNKYLGQLAAFDRYWAQYLGDQLKLWAQCPLKAYNIPKTFEQLRQSLIDTKKIVKDKLQAFIDWEQQDKDFQFWVPEHKLILKLLEVVMNIVQYLLKHMAPESLKLKTMQKLFLGKEFLERGIDLNKI
ncbi:uncharacterized protein LOC128953255 [Oppia nitens]|uniref:uncharacterized protein LOC128953255 n=1 Tax=Oppia nitens TaxID=1686743 RepID=UPI0023DCE7F0|nr:uncharacterized protein LOC128953255 [Oppia nitens]